MLVKVRSRSYGVEGLEVQSFGGILSIGFSYFAWDNDRPMLGLVG
jgi:hypothetical protein